MDYPKRVQNRLTKYDYSLPNAYFITICTDKRKNIFWRNDHTIVDYSRDMPLNKHGIIVKQCIKSIPTYYPSITVDNYVIMPNHVHLLLQIHSDVDGRSMIAPTISTVVKMMKGAVSKRVGFAVWQKGFYDHVIRSEADYQEIWEYIDANPGRWAEDKLYNHTLLFPEEFL